MTILVSLTTSLSFGQDRVNREKLSFLDKSNRLTTSVGWSYNTTLGEWVDYNNVIDSDKSYKGRYRTLQGSYMMSHRPQSFISIQTNTLIYDNFKYYVVLVEKWTGHYIYPNIKEDWKIYKTMFAYIFTETEYNKLNNINGTVILNTLCVVSMSAYYETYNEIVLLDKIQTRLSVKPSGYETYTFPIKKTENGNIRFNVPYSLATTLRDKEYFDKNYFETASDNFSKLIIK